jgi:hypothetical protein
MKELLLRKIVTTKTCKMVTTISNGHPKMVETISKDHLNQTITERPSTFKVFPYLSASNVHVPPTNFLSRYAINIVKC